MCNYGLRYNKAEKSGKRLLKSVRYVELVLKEVLIVNIAITNVETLLKMLGEEYNA